MGWRKAVVTSSARRTHACHSSNFGFRGWYVGTFYRYIWTNTPRYGLPDRFRGSADGQGFAQWFRKMYTATKYHEPSRDFGNTYCGF